MIYTDKNGTEIKKGMIVKFNNQEGEMRRKYEPGASIKFTLVPKMALDAFQEGVAESAT